MRNIVSILFVIIAAAFWWLILDARAPKSADGEFDITAWRSLIAEDDRLPSEVRVEVVGRDSAGHFAAEAGAGLDKIEIYYTAAQLVTPDGTIIIDAAVDEAAAKEVSQTKGAEFFANAYERLLNAVSAADQVFITHEHIDHVMAVTRHPAPEKFVARARLTAEQISALPQFAPPHGLSPLLHDLAPTDFSKPTRVAPGVVVAPAPGHTPGSLVFFVRRDDGREFLFIGDIVWTMTNISNLKTRPRLLQYIFFKPREDRPHVLAQVRALHDLAEDEPNLVIIPSHDGLWLEQLFAKGVVEKGFE